MCASKGIKSVLITRRNDPDIKIGTEFWRGSMFDNDGSLIIVSDPYFRPWNAIGGGAWWFKAIDSRGHVIEVSPGDLGMDRYAYDDRPDQFCLSVTEQQICIEKHREWFERQEQEDPCAWLHDDWY